MHSVINGIILLVKVQGRDHTPSNSQIKLDKRTNSLKILIIKFSSLCDIVSDTSYYL
jgi:hypothetical protein